MPNATIAAGMVISFGNVLLHHDHHKMVEDRIVVVGTPEDVEEAVEEDAEVVVEDQQPVGAALVTSGPDAPVPDMTQNAGAAAVPGPNPSGAGSGN